MDVRADPVNEIKLVEPIARRRRRIALAATALAVMVAAFVASVGNVVAGFTASVRHLAGGAPGGGPNSFVFLGSAAVMAIGLAIGGSLVRSLLGVRGRRPVRTRGRYR